MSGVQSWETTIVSVTQTCAQHAGQELSTKRGRVSAHDGEILEIRACCVGGDILHCSLQKSSSSLMTKKKREKVATLRSPESMTSSVSPKPGE